MPARKKSYGYITEYFEAIKKKKAIAPKTIKTWYSIVIGELNKKNYFFSEERASEVILFMETFLHHYEGKLAPQLIKLELWQKAFLSVVFGVLDKEGYRQFNEVLLLCGRKNGKTLLNAGIAEYMLFLDEYGPKVYFAAPKIDQARICYKAFLASIKKEPELLREIHKSRDEITVPINDGEAKPIPFTPKTSDGLNISCVICDELAAWPAKQGKEFYEVLRGSFGSREQPLLLSITTANKVKNGPFDEVMNRATRILKGGSSEKKLAPFLYVLDDNEKFFDLNEIKKANPNFGVSLLEKNIKADIDVAKTSISKLVEFKMKVCNIQQNSSEAWLQASSVQKSIGEELKLEDFRNSYAVLGIDLSRTTDLTAAVLVIQKEGIYYIIPHFWMPAEKIDFMSSRDSIPYQEYIDKGWLSISGEVFVDYKDVFAWCVSLVQNYEIYPLKVGYDRYSAQYLVQEMKSFGFHMDDVYQGWNLTPVIDEFEGMIDSGIVRIGNNDLLAIHLLDTALEIDNQNKKKKIVKLDMNKSHIDGTAALLCAMTVKQKWHSEIGEQLKNED